MSPAPSPPIPSSAVPSPPVFSPSTPSPPVFSPPTPFPPAPSDKAGGPPMAGHVRRGVRSGSSRYTACERDEAACTVVALVARRRVPSSIAAIASAALFTITPAPLVRADGQEGPTEGRAAGVEEEFCSSESFIEFCFGFCFDGWAGWSRAGVVCVVPPASRRAQGAPSCKRSVTTLPAISSALTRHAGTSAGRSLISCSKMPRVVHVFPEPVWPKHMTVAWAPPEKASAASGRTAAAYSSAVERVSSNTASA